ncbi:voltage-gated protein/chloride channel-like protein [Xylona heveae TC161]|uniref:Voltage-gated protein/chloride channel-like protein n=1 Tax=Xylona heveae (strain CBS 132557 / TC161) TaxID=1328760 RepID=A0A165FXD3_XYLHT|nr:voltage-gated protein/chloride channel-like protein [Xylona heveae TC161]KZF21498.1 voltage-gated protein/chloride channel-like protein [Xylona heveae TC161]
MSSTTPSESRKDAPADNDEGIDSSQQSATPSSPTASRRLYSSRASDLELRGGRPRNKGAADEQTSLLSQRDTAGRAYRTLPPTPGQRLSRQPSNIGNSRFKFNHHRKGSFGQRLAAALGSDGWQDSNLEDSKISFYRDDRVWYDQFTSTDWVHDSIADAFRVKDLRNRKDLRGRVYAWFDGAQGWILVAIIGCITAAIAYLVDITETPIFDLKDGYCTIGWYRSKKKCCAGLDEHVCPSWLSWSEALRPSRTKDARLDFFIYVLAGVFLSLISCILTLGTKTVVPSAVSLSTLDENLGAENRYENRRHDSGGSGSVSPRQKYTEVQQSSTMIYYAAAGSGVAEVKVILSGFVLHGYLGVKTLVLKTLGLILSVASGLSLGKEGPYVHIATCVGNIACRIFSKYNHNDGKRREVLSASAASGVAVAFGAPLGGVLFSLEEVSYYFPPKTLFRTFFCCIVAALFLKFLNPYGTNKIVLFEVRYLTDWEFFEMIVFIILGVLGGAAGALFIKASRIWATSFRRIKLIKKWPMLEVGLVALITGLVGYWNRYTKLAVTELLYELASPCNSKGIEGSGLCPSKEQIPEVIRYLGIAFVVKSFLTIITFGVKVPAGIYVPSMVVGGLLGRIVGHTVQYIVLMHPNTTIFGACAKGKGTESCVTPGIYAMVAAGATMCGVTRLSVALAVILFELTGSLDHVLPFSIAVLVSKWTADALEPLSIYDLLTSMNSYPFLDNKVRPIFTTDLGDITPRIRRDRIIDISDSPLIPAADLRLKLERLHMAGELDGGLPIVRHGILVGLIPAPDLEFALDKLDDGPETLCLMATDVQWRGAVAEEEDEEADPTDFTPYIDPAPVALDIRSPMDLVYECFVKLGLRYICVLRNGKYAGLVHKKAFVKYTRELES